MIEPQADSGTPGARPGDQPRISVVLPVHDSVATIERTIASVLGQSHAGFELLVIDDGSTDRTLELVSRIADPRIRVFSFPNAGPAASRNRGIARARGEFIAFIDADDLWTPAKLASQLAALDQNPAAVLVYTWSDCIDEHDRYFGHGSHVIAEGRVYEQLLVSNFIDNGSCAMARKAALVEAGLFDETLWGPEDWDLWLRVAWRHPFACVPVPMTLYRVHGGTVSSQIRRQESASLKVFHAGLARLPASRHKDELERAGLAALYRYLISRAVVAPRGGMSVVLVAEYCRVYLQYAQLRPANIWYAAGQLGKSLIVMGLPSALSRRVLGAIRALRNRRRRMTRA